MKKEQIKAIREKRIKGKVDALTLDERIEANPKVMLGKPVIKGTRITVELILRQLGAGMTMDEVLENYPHLTREDLRAAIRYAASLVAEERVYPFFYEKHDKARVLA
ncbi:MAG: DUF433 domain-containing protein [Nanoarchaeota archaeon]|nr:DUF433 domain-containing protein [Nanoarchaeota archaeon]